MRKKQLAEKRDVAIRNNPLTRTQLRSLMMTYLKHTDFVPIGSEEDERLIQKMNKKATEEEQLKAFLNIVLDEEGEVNYEVLEKRYPIVDWESKFYHTDRYGKPHDYYRVFRANGSSRYIKTFTEMVSRFDRTMFKENANDDLWKNQEEWILKSWNFYENCGVHILVLEDDTEIHMLAERKYLLTKALRGFFQKLYGSQLTMLHSKELASPKQMAVGKDFSNPLIVDSLLKTIWLSMHHVIAMKHWLFQSKRLLVKKSVYGW
ncbi:hypothetical protein Tco_0906270 [Tanacetum coccineum]